VTRDGTLERLASVVGLGRLRRLEDRVALEDLMIAYNRALDVPIGKGERVAACFTEDGQWDSVGPHGDPALSAYGRSALVAKFDRNSARMPFSAHFVSAGQVAILGDEATGEWQYFQMATYRDGTALWIAGTYDVTFRRTSRGWRIARMQVANWFTTPYEQGWGRVEHLATP
jgi:SnoaL-like domain